MEKLSAYRQLRPDLKLFAADKAGAHEKYPAGLRIPKGGSRARQAAWLDGSIDAITCMHLIEHLNDLTLLVGKPRGCSREAGESISRPRIPKRSRCPVRAALAAGTFTLNFFDDPLMLRP